MKLYFRNQWNIMWSARSKRSGEFVWSEGNLKREEK